MTDQGYEFVLPKSEQTIIKVIGIGGGGSNAVTHMQKQGIRNVEFIICNTDKQALNESSVSTKLQIGTQLTEGLGVGACPQKGREAAEESKEEIKELLKEQTKMLFITAGMGGGTGTGAAPVIAQIAQELNILTVGIVTMPFQFEGKRKNRQAEEGIVQLRSYCDIVLVILNEKLREMYGSLSMVEAFAKADNILTTAAKSIAEIITVPGYVNVDFQDVSTVIKDAGNAVMGRGEANGENRALRAIEAATTSPLLSSQSIQGAKKILLSITASQTDEMQMDELSVITEYVQSKVGDDAEVIFGNIVDNNLEDKIGVTIIATGFQRTNTPSVFDQDHKIVHDLEMPYSPLDASQSSKSEDIQAPAKENGHTTYWDMQSEEETEVKNSENKFEVEDPCSIIQHHTETQEEEPLEDLKDAAIPIDSKHTLTTERDERVKKFRGVKNPNELNREDFKEKIERPAYLRKKVALPEIPHSVHRNLSRLYLDPENKVLGKNRFLHDNVD